jgi:hypothetical protein
MLKLLDKLILAASINRKDIRDDSGPPLAPTLEILPDDEEDTTDAPTMELTQV